MSIKKIVEQNNMIPKARRYMIFNLSVFDTLTDEERVLYNAYHRAKKDDKDLLKNIWVEELKKYSDIRTIESKKLYQDDGTPCLERIIAGFENEAVRLCSSFKFDESNPKQIPLVKEFVILDCSNIILLEQIIEKGIIIDGQKYFVYSSSTNQQKNKQVCLMQIDFFEKNKSKLLCGLTLNVINSHGGCNTGKFLAYTSLIFSKSVEIPFKINIDEVIVLPEFETLVTSKVNFLDMDSQTIKERTLPVPVNHLDGAGMFLPGVLPQSAQIRGGYIKGCVFPFDFRQFIIEKQKEGIIEEDAVILDDWGNPVSIAYIRDNIKLILNSSQLKMRKYYKSWDEYKEKFKENDLQICINNTMHYPKTDNPFTMSAYQFYQTIPRQNLTDEHIERLCENTISIIERYKTDKNTVLEVLGVDGEDKEMIPFHASICTYPDMVYDNYVRSRVESKIKKIRNKGMAGKPFIKGFYNYICPDLYAACEFWFCGEKNPNGLIPENHVYNSFYDDKDTIQEVCCLRSPHLSDCEHGIRTLIKSEECKRWFHGMDTVISTHDLLTKTLQCDVDGDEMLTCHDEAFIKLVDRSKIPLYYEMKKGDAVEVNNQNILACLKRSFENSQIGKISNALTKYLNKTEEPALNFVRVMTAYNNFCIDYPKSQYMPVLNQNYQNLLEELSDAQTLFPYFFKYAKGKLSEQCEEYKEDEKSNVNRISKYIMGKTRRNTNNLWKDNSDNSKFCPEYLQIQDYVIKRSSDEYKELQKVLIQLKAMNNNGFRKKLNEKYSTTEKKNQLGYEPYYFYCNQRILDIIKKNYSTAECIGIRRKAAAYLLDIEYFQEENLNSNKDILWNCFGDILYDNLCDNLNAVKDGKVIKIKRMAYQSAEKKKLDIAEKAKEVADELAKIFEVNITKAELDYIMTIPCRKKCEHDRYLLYLLLVLYKRKLCFLDALEKQDEISEDNRAHFKIYKRSKFKKTTRATLDKWIGLGKRITIADSGLKRLEKKGLIRVTSCKDYDKIYLNFLDEIKPNSEVLFTVVSKNPMFDLFLYNRDVKISKCEICGCPFPAVANAKTCSDDCSRKLTLRNKNKNVS